MWHIKWSKQRSIHYYKMTAAASGWTFQRYGNSHSDSKEERMLLRPHTYTYKRDGWIVVGIVVGWSVHFMTVPAHRKLVIVLRITSKDNWILRGTNFVCAVIYVYAQIRCPFFRHNKKNTFWALNSPCVLQNLHKGGLQMVCIKKYFIWTHCRI